MGAFAFYLQAVETGIHPEGKAVHRDRRPVHADAGHHRVVFQRRQIFLERVRRQPPLADDPGGQDQHSREGRV